MKVLNNLITAIALTLSPLALADATPPTSLSCDVKITLPNGEISQRTFAGAQDDGGSSYLIASGVVGLRDDNAVDVYVYFDGEYSSINISHGTTGTRFVSDAQVTGPLFVLLANTPTYPYFKELFVRCHGIR